MRKSTRTKIAAIFYLLAVIDLSSCHKIMIRPVDRYLPESAELIIHKQLSLCDPVLELMRLTNLDIATNLNDAIPPTQEGWLRPHGSERAHLLEKNRDLPIFMRQFDRLGLLAEILPSKNEYDYVLLLGAMYDTFKYRLDWLEQAIVNGLKVKIIVLMGSHRPLEQRHELDRMSKNHIFKKHPLTEIEMMEALIAQSSIKNLQPNIKFIKVASSMKQRNGILMRANTRDTVIDFLDLNQKPGSVLAISSQPHVLRQDLVIRSHLFMPWQIETVGKNAPINLPTSVYLDELARILYQLKTFLSLEPMD
jgi:hypothetical protein